jgi:CRISPR-associated protein Cas1
MNTLYVTEQGAKIRKTGHRLFVEKDDENLLEIRCREFSEVLLFGNIQVSTQAMREMLGQGVSFSLLSRDGRFIGSLVPPLSGNAPLRLRQYVINQEPSAQLEYSRAFVRAKIESFLESLKDWTWKHRECQLQPIVHALQSSLQSLERSSNRDSIRGVEGSATRRYWESFPERILNPEYRWNGRSRRPPRDPFNAMLSLGYVILTTRIEGLIRGMGMDPHFGHLHHLDYGRSSLALDHLEPHRVRIVDRFVLRIANKRIIHAHEFEETEEGGYLLERGALKTYLAQWDLFLKETSWHDHIASQLSGYRSSLDREHTMPFSLHWKQAS